jgi:hypothetical protein
MHTAIPATEEAIMLSHYRTFVGILIMGLGLTGCDDLFGSNRSWFRADLSISGSMNMPDTTRVTDLYEGQGTFYMGEDRAAGVRMRFDLSSSGSSASADHSFNLHRRGDGRPSTGTYTLSTLDQGDPKIA